MDKEKELVSYLDGYIATEVKNFVKNLFETDIDIVAQCYMKIFHDIHEYEVNQQFLTKWKEEKKAYYQLDSDNTLSTVAVDNSYTNKSDSSSIVTKKRDFVATSDEYNEETFHPNLVLEHSTDSETTNKRSKITNAVYLTNDHAVVQNRNDEKEDKDEENCDDDDDVVDDIVDDIVDDDDGGDSFNKNNSDSSDDWQGKKSNHVRQNVAVRVENIEIEEDNFQIIDDVDTYDNFAVLIKLEDLEEEATSYIKAWNTNYLQSLDKKRQFHFGQNLYSCFLFFRIRKINNYFKYPEVKCQQCEVFHDLFCYLNSWLDDVEVRPHFKNYEMPTIRNMVLKRYLNNLIDKIESSVYKHVNYIIRVERRIIERQANLLVENFILQNYLDYDYELPKNWFIEFKNDRIIRKRSNTYPDPNDYQDKEFPYLWQTINKWTDEKEENIAAGKVHRNSYKVTIRMQQIRPNVAKFAGNRFGIPDFKLSNNFWREFVKERQLRKNGFLQYNLAYSKTLSASHFNANSTTAKPRYKCL